ncbi:MAG TPA: amidohydrolase family protein [Devosiaceae bacterium]|jgi:predicted TIM-barrel fold metal-dependent hydrolase
MTQRNYPLIDSHAHVFGPSYAFSNPPSYTPHPSQRGTAQQFLAVLDAHGLDYGLVVAAQPYGTDNSCMLDAIAASRGRLKGVALVDPSAGLAAWEDMHQRGVIGLRINLTTFGLKELMHPEAQRLFAFAKEIGWLLQVHCKGDELVDAVPLLRQTGLRLMFDHFGRPVLAKGQGQPGFQALLELGRSSDAIVKLSGPFRCSMAGAPYEDTDSFVAAAIEAFTLDRCVWGSDWPFVPWEERVDYGPVYQSLYRWLPDEADRKRVLSDNPLKFFGFKR